MHAYILEQPSILGNKKLLLGLQQPRCFNGMFFFFFISLTGIYLAEKKDLDVEW